jgi:peptidoglycan/xylan/chitin deacetylase (PgdA/CDA1 family)
MNKRKKGISSFDIQFVIFVAVVSLLSIFVIFDSTNSQAKEISVEKILPSPTPTAIPSPTPTPTPVYTGYCLTVPVLLYHHIQPQARAIERGQASISVDNGVFDGQMGYLRSQGYTTITAKQLADALRTKSGLPAKSIVVTLDDGYKDNHEFALPIIQKYGITANILLSSGLMEGPDYLSWSQVNDMKNTGLVYFVNHTWSHFALPRGDAQKITDEINTAKGQIESHTGQVVDVFGYPYGSFNDQSISILQGLGYVGAYSTNPGWIQCDSFIMALHRNRVGNSPLSAYGL